MSGFFHSTEFYVIASIAAAAVVILFMRPQSRGEAIERLLAGTLCDTGHPDAPPTVSLFCSEDGTVLLTRSGLIGMTGDSALSLAVTVAGGDISVEERVTMSAPLPGTVTRPVDAALFTLDFLRPGRYHVRYNSSSLGLFTAFTMSVSPGNTLTRLLRQ